MSLRGHRDDSKYYDDKGNNPGNFQVMLEYRARSGDTVLAEHLKRTKENNGGRNCTYRSKTIQNEVIKCFEQELRGIIISEVKQAKFFSVMADECSDVANKEQLAIVRNSKLSVAGSCASACSWTDVYFHAPGVRQE